MHSSRLFSFILFLVPCAICVDIRSLFGPSLSSDAQIFLPSDAEYAANVTQRWDKFAEPQYIGAIKPASEQDIQNIISTAAKNKVPFLFTGGGHGTSTTLSRLHDGIDVDLGNFDAVHLDAAKNRLTVGGATTFSQVIDLLYGANKEFPTASASCVGIVGATLAAGVNNLQGVRGLLIDSLVSLRLITATGKIVNVSANENPHLFWALRGAGSNFGVVTSATYKIYDAINGGQVVNADYLYPASANRSVWKALESYDSTLPAQLALTAFVLANGTAREPLIAINALYHGPEAQAKPYLAHFDAIPHILSNVTSISWNQAINAAFFGSTNGACVRQNNVNIYSLALKRTDTATWESHFTELAAFYVKYPEYQGRFLAERYPTQAVLAVPDAQTAYPYREAKWQLNLEGWYNDPALDDPVNTFLNASRAKFQRTSGFDTLSVYTGYAHGDEGATSWYSPRKLGRLASLKCKWDPNRLFSWNNPIAIIPSCR